MNKIILYLLPPRKLRAVPRHISADYDRPAMSTEQQLVLMAGLARDPDAAQKKWDQLERKHGENTLQHIRFLLRKRRAKTVKQRFWMLMRRLLGEQEPVLKERRRTVEPRVLVGFARHKVDEHETS